MNEFSNQQNTTRSGAQTDAMAIPESVLTASCSRPNRVLIESYSRPDPVLISKTCKNRQKTAEFSDDRNLTKKSRVVMVDACHAAARATPRSHLPVSRPHDLIPPS